MASQYPDYGTYADPLTAGDLGANYWGAYTPLAYSQTLFPLPTLTDPTGSVASAVPPTDYPGLPTGYLGPVASDTTSVYGSTSSPNGIAPSSSNNVLELGNVGASTADNLSMYMPPYSGYSECSSFYSGAQIPQLPLPDGNSGAPGTSSAYPGHHIMQSVNQGSPDFDYAPLMQAGVSNLSSGPSSSQMPIRPSLKKKTRSMRGESEEDDASFTDEKDTTGRRSTNNARERVRVRDINSAFKELGRLIAALFPNQNQKELTKNEILHQAFNSIIHLEEKVRSKNLDPKVAASLRRRTDEDLNKFQPQDPSQMNYQ